jgi:hypothetical protein
MLNDHDDGIREAEAMQDIRDEINNPIWCELGYRLVLDPLGKLVDSHQYMGETSWRRVKGPIISRLQQANGQDGGMVMRL